MTEDLTFSDFLSQFDQLGKGEWLTAYSHTSSGLEGPVFYSALIREDMVHKSLQDPSWDLRIGDGRPGFSFRWEGGAQISTYCRCSDEGIEPLLLRRDFHGLRPGYWELAEEFRLYFDLCEDRPSGRFILLNENGDEEDVVSISEKEIKVKLRLVREFLAAKKMRLAIFFDFNRFSEMTLDELGIEEFHHIRRTEDSVISIGARPWDGMSHDNHRSQAFLMGKKLVSGDPNFKPSLFGRQERQFAEFVIGVDDQGQDVMHTCDEDRLANFFGKNQGAPQYVTPVFFRREVLSKYFSHPAKYSVEDGHVRCGTLWGLRIDNNNPRHVMVFLGDLGRLAYSEQLHWKSFNVSSGKMSHTAFARAIEGQFADPEDPALLLKQRLSSFQKKWETKFGWKLFRSMGEGDEYYLTVLRVPLTNDQREFDEQVLAITKILVDSLNEKALEQSTAERRENAKGLDKLEVFLSANGVEIPKMIEFLRKLQALRSSASAHLKGAKYEKVKDYFSIGKRDLSTVFEDILVKCIWTLNTLENHFLS